MTLSRTLPRPLSPSEFARELASFGGHLWVGFDLAGNEGEVELPEPEEIATWLLALGISAVLRGEVADLLTEDDAVVILHRAGGEWRVVQNCFGELPAGDRLTIERSTCLWEDKHTREMIARELQSRRVLDSLTIEPDRDMP